MFGCVWVWLDVMALLVCLWVWGCLYDFSLWDEFGSGVVFVCDLGLVCWVWLFWCLFVWFVGQFCVVLVLLCLLTLCCRLGCWCSFVVGLHILVWFRCVGFLLGLWLIVLLCAIDVMC